MAIARAPPEPDSLLSTMTQTPVATSTALALSRVLTDILGLPASSTALHDDANLFDLGLDSLGVVRFVADTEAALGIRVPDEALRADMFERFSRLLACIEEQVAQERA